MTATDNMRWRNILDLIKKKQYSHIHKHYSTKEGWAVLSYKRISIKVTFLDSEIRVEEILNSFR